MFHLSWRRFAHADPDDGARRPGGFRRFAIVGLTSLAAMVGVQSTISPAYAQPTFEGCAPGYLCLYAGAYYNNHSWQPTARYYRCGTFNLSGWVTRHGSYVNNQTGSVTSTLWSGYGGSGAALRRSVSYPGPYWYDADFDFYPVNSITVC